jgi:hypothetical protein
VAATPPPAAGAVVAEEAGAGALKPAAPKPVIKRTARPAVVRKTASASVDDLLAPKAAAPAPKAKPAKGKAKAWVDPFAE